MTSTRDLGLDAESRAERELCRLGYRILHRNYRAERGELDLEFLRALPLAQARSYLERLPGVGPKTAACVLVFALEQPAIPVDTHVHRISNRLGYVATRDPEATEMALRARLPRRYWIGYNDLLVAFGQNVCTPISPRCSTCPVSDLCRRIGVTSSR